MSWLFNCKFSYYLVPNTNSKDHYIKKQYGKKVLGCVISLQFEKPFKLQFVTWRKCLGYTRAMAEGSCNGCVLCGLFNGSKKKRNKLLTQQSVSACHSHPKAAPEELALLVSDLMPSLLLLLSMTTPLLWLPAVPRTLLFFTSALDFFCFFFSSFCSWDLVIRHMRMVSFMPVCF